MPLTYSDYLQLDRLLALQQRKSPGPEHDEMLFIVIHQVYELWFREVLHEVDHLGALIDGDETARAQHTLARIRTILKTMVGQVDVLETMTPLEFLSFRDFLESASGFQSYQFRELEFALGKKDPTVLARFPDGSTARTNLEHRLHEPHLWRKVLAFLARAGYAIPDEILRREPEAAVEESSEVQAVLMAVYRGDPILSRLCELLVDVDEGLQEWRYRHVKMVERTIGTKIGTGGSPGAAYLKSTLFTPMWPDLWAIRGEF